MIEKIISQAIKPELYKSGTSFMWTDEHIAKQLLKIHLDPEIDLASRKKESIKKTVLWILEQCKGNETMNILDLGCGPGLYSECFAKKGNTVTGIDISKLSIDYAKQSAHEQYLNIKYINANYLEYDIREDFYDLIVLIYTDFGVLKPDDRELLLHKIYKALKKGGIFIFDVLNDKQIESKAVPKSWEASKSGFWRDIPYLALSESYVYKDENLILYQHIVADSEEKVEIYRFWTHFFSQKGIMTIMKRCGFYNIQCYDDILPAGDEWNGDNVLFCKSERHS